MKTLTDNQKKEITKISMEFAEPFYEMTGGISGSSWIIVDPLSAYLNVAGYENKLQQIPESEEHPQILFMEFQDGSMFIPAGSDIPKEGTTDWMWI